MNFFEYFNIYFLIFVILSICIVIFTISFSFVFQKLEFEKNSSYECGFNSFSNTRTIIDIEFYLIGILFIVFDLEIFFLFLWITILYKINLFNICVIFLFIFVLFIGLIYEFLVKALDW